MVEFFATAEYGTPGGNVRTWAGMVEAPDIQAANQLAEEKLRRERRVARLWRITVRAPL